MSNNKKREHISTIACSALFVAISILCGKYLAFPIGNILRFSFENLPIILSGFLFGPIVAAITAALADIIGCILVAYAINPLVLLGGISIGVISGICGRCFKKLSLPLRVALSVFLSHAIGSVVIKTIGLVSWYPMPFVELMLWRALNYLVVGAVEFILLYAILKNKMFTSQIEETLHKRI